MAGISASPPNLAEAMNGAVESDQPYLSLVVTARNDDHGGNLLTRMQVFVNAWIAQCKAYNLTAELIIVEWNPPPDRPRLSAALRWPGDTGPCRVRFIEVPPEIHARYGHAEALPLYQMIAKNAGIRRAQGRFVLATNIDIVFSDELMQFLAEGRLDARRMYRIDRHDVMSDVPVDAPVEEQLAYCRGHLIRINAREGTFKLTSDGRRGLSSEDITSAASGIALGRGWFPVERHGLQGAFRWVHDDAEMMLTLPSPSSPPPLLLEIEPGPGVAEGGLSLQVLDEDQNILAETAVERYAELRLLLTPCGRPTRTLYLRVAGGGLPTDHDPRALNLRVFRCEWGKTRRASPAERCQLQVTYIRGRKTGLRPRYWLRSHPLVRFYMEAGGPVAAIRQAFLWVLRRRALVAKAPTGKDIFQPGGGIVPGTGWYAKEHFLGETFRWIRNQAELIITPAAGANNLLGLQMEPGPGVNHDPFELLVRDERGEIVARAPVRKLQFVTLPIPRDSSKMQVFTLGIDGGDLPVSHEPRILNFRLFWCGWVGKAGKPVKIDPATEDAAMAAIQQVIEAAEAERSPESAARTGKVVSTKPRPANAAFLHTNGCGDFTLMAREHWFNLRGYPEFDLFSMNLDSVLCYAAHHAGVREEMLQEPMRIYHIEHATGSGWTPEGQARLFERIAAKGISIVDYAQVVRWINDMRRFNAPLIFNLENWGLADLDLKERVPDTKPQAHAIEA